MIGGDLILFVRCRILDKCLKRNPLSVDTISLRAPLGQMRKPFLHGNDLSQTPSEEQPVYVPLHHAL